MRFRTVRVALAAFSIAAIGCKSSDPSPQEGRDGSGATTAASTAGLSDSALLARADQARIQGDSSAAVWLLEISDFQCPYCAMWHRDTYPALVNEYVRTGKIRMAYINLPLSSHQHAQPAAEAAMCAGIQGKFWPVHDAIFKSQEQWSSLGDATAAFDSIAARAGVSMPDWRSCLKDGKTAAMVGADAARASQIGVQSTPSFLVMRGQEVVRGIAGAYPVDTFRVVLDGALAGATPRP